MSGCRDLRINFLSALGYNVVRYPRSRIMPLDVIVMNDGDPIWLGPIDRVWRPKDEPDVPIPEVGEPEVAADISGKSTRTLRLQLGLDILGDVLAAMGAPIPGLKAKYEKADGVRFSFCDVELRGSDPLAVGNYLARGELDQANPFVTRFFDDEQSQLYLLTQVLRSRAFSVVTVDSEDSEIAIEVPVVPELLKASLTVSAPSSEATSITYEGTQTLTFGFVAVELRYRDGNWVVVRWPEPGEVFLEGEGPAPAGGPCECPARPGAVLLRGASRVELVEAEDAM